MISACLCAPATVTALTVPTALAAAACTGPCQDCYPLQLGPQSAAWPLQLKCKRETLHCLAMLSNAAVIFCTTHEGHASAANIPCGTLLNADVCTLCTHWSWMYNGNWYVVSGQVFCQELASHVCRCFAHAVTILQQHSTTLVACCADEQLTS